MALSTTDLTASGANFSAGVSTWNTASVSPAANALLVVFAAYSVSGGTTITVSGFGLTWTQQKTVTISSSTKVDCWTALTGGSPPTPGSVSITAGAASTMNWDVSQTTGVSTVTPVVTANNTSTAPATNAAGSITMGAASNTGNRFLAGFGVAGGPTFSAASWTQLSAQLHSGAGTSALETQVSPNSTGLTATVTLSASLAWAAIGIEAAVALTGTPVSDAELGGFHESSPLSYDAQVLADGPLSYWPDTNTADATGHNHTLTPHNAPATVPVPNGDSAWHFDGLTQYCETPDANDLSPVTTGIFTIEAWLRPDVLTFVNEEATGYVHWSGKGTTGTQEWVTRMYGADNTEARENRVSAYAFNLSGGLGQGAFFETPGGETPGVWLHVCATINSVNTSVTWPSGYVIMYRNAVTTNTQTLAGIALGNGPTPARLGTRDLVSFFQGGIGKYALYNFELSAARILAHYNAMNDVYLQGMVTVRSSDTFAGADIGEPAQVGQQLINSAEGQPDTTVATAANTGGGSGTAFDAVTKTLTGALTFSTTVAPAHGLAAYLVATGASASTSYLAWSTSYLGLSTSLAQAWLRVYLYLPSLPSVAAPVAQVVTAAGAAAATLWANPAGTLKVTDAAGVTQLTSVTAAAAGAWMRAEMHVVGSATAGQMELRVFKTIPDDFVPEEAISTGFTKNTSGLLGAIRYGVPIATAGLTYRLDDLGASSLGWIGPAVAPADTGGMTEGVVVVGVNDAVGFP